MTMMPYARHIARYFTLLVIAFSSTTTLFAQTSSNARALAISPNSRYLLAKKTTTAILDGAIDAPVSAARIYLPPDENAALVPVATISEGSTIVARLGVNGLGWYTPNSERPFTLAGQVDAVRTRALRDKIVASTKDNRIVVLRAGTEQIVYQPVASEINVDVAISSDGKRVAYSYRKQNTGQGFIEIKALDGSTFVWRVETSVAASNLALSPDGERVIAFLHNNLEGLPFTDRSKWMLWRIGDDQSVELHFDASLAPRIDLPLPPGGLPLPPPATPLPNPTATPTPPTYLIDQWGSDAGSFSPDGRRIVVSNVLGGLAVFDASGQRSNAPVHSFTLPLQLWAASYQHGHRWSGPSIIAYSASANEIVPGEIKERAWRVNLETRQAERLVFHSDISRLLGVDVSNWPDRLLVDGSGRARAILPFRQSKFVIYSLPDLQKRGEGMSVEDLQDEVGGTGARLEYFGSPNHAVFNDGIHFVIEDAQRVRIVNGATGAVISEGPTSMMFRHLGSSDAAVLYTWAGASPGNKLRAAFFRGSLKVREIEVTVSGPNEEQFWMGHGGAVRGPVQLPSAGSSTWTVYSSSGETQGSFSLNIPQKTDVIVYGRLNNNVPGMLLSGPLDSANPGFHSVWWQKMTGEVEVLAQRLNWQPMGLISADGERLAAFFSRREGQTVKRLGLRVWGLESSGKFVEKKYSAAERYDASEFQRLFPNNNRLWANSSDLRIVAIPVGDHIEVIDIDRDRLIGTTRIGEPLAVTADYLVLSSIEGSIQVWPLGGSSP